MFWLQRADFAAFLDPHPHAALVMQDATLRDVPARLAWVLPDLAARHGHAIPQGIPIESRMLPTVPGVEALLREHPGSRRYGQVISVATSGLPDRV